MENENKINLKYRFEKAPVTKRSLSNPIERFGILASQMVQNSPSLIPHLAFGRSEYISGGEIDPGLMALQPKMDKPPENIRIRCIEDSSGTLIEYHYDKAGRISEVILLGSLCEKYSWSDEGKLLSVSESNLLQTQFKYTHDGFLSLIHYPDGSIFKYEYDETQNSTTIIYPDGILLKLKRDDLGQLTRAESRDGTFELTWDNDRNLQKIHFYCVAGDWLFISDRSTKKLKIQFHLQQSGVNTSVSSALGYWRLNPSGTPLEMFIPSGERLLNRSCEEKREIISWSNNGQVVYRLDKSRAVMSILNFDGTHTVFKRLMSKKSVLFLSALGIGILNYDENGNLRRVRDQFGQGALYSYASNNELKSVISKGQRLFMSWTEKSNLYKIEIEKYLHGSIIRKNGYPEYITLLSDSFTQIEKGLNLIGTLWNWECLKLTRRLLDIVLKEPHQ